MWQLVVVLCPGTSINSKSDEFFPLNSPFALAALWLAECHWERTAGRQRRASDSLLQRSERFMSLDPFVFYLTHYALAAINQFYGFVNQTALMVSHVSISGAIMHGMAFIMWLFALSWRKLFHIHCCMSFFKFSMVLMYGKNVGLHMQKWGESN